MLEKPDLPEELIYTQVQATYRLHPASLTFLPLGADVNTAVYRLLALDGLEYFIKLRKGVFDEISVDLPAFLVSQGMRAIIPPVENCLGKRWSELNAYKMIVYPYVIGEDGYNLPLTSSQWLEFGAAVQAIHAATLPPEILQRIPLETFTPRWRDLVRDFLARVEHATYTEPVAVKLADFIRANREIVHNLLARVESLSQELQAQPRDLVLCHADLHAGNLLITPQGSLYIVDWDNPCLAPKEHDLMHIGGSSIWNDPHAASLFYQGYGPAQIDLQALAYYRGERVLQDIAEFCTQLLLTEAGGADREQAYHWFTGQFLPGHEIEIALR